MKSIKSIAPLLLLAFLIGTIGCQSDDFGVNNSSDLANLSSDDFAVVDYDDFVASVEDATFDKAPAFNPIFQNDGFNGPGRNGHGPGGMGGFIRDGRHPGHKGSHLRGILRELNLTDDQVSQVHELISGHRESLSEVFEALREANAEILEAARTDRAAILEAMRNGDITREEAREQLQALSEATRDAIRNNPETEELRQQICDAKLELFTSIRTLLDETQQAAWDEWVANLDGPCFGDGA